MGCIHLLLLVIIGLPVYLNEPWTYNVQSLNPNFVQQPLIRKHFLKRRILYNSNSYASFQIEVLKAGDIHRNPGPTANVSEESVHTHAQPKYSRESLITIQKDCNRRLSHNVYSIIKSLGLNRRRATRRGTRGGQQTKARSQLRVTCTSPLQTSHYDHDTQQSLALSATEAGIAEHHIPVVEFMPRHNQPIEHSGCHSRGISNLVQIPRSHINSAGQESLTLCTVNFRSLRNKSAAVLDYVRDSKADLYAITETWLTENDAAVINDIVPPGYKFLHHPRACRRGGGTGLLYKDTIDVHEVKAGETKSFEFAVNNITFGSCQLRIVNLYRPPYSENHRIPISTFLSEFSEFIQPHLMSNIPIILTGDYNIHVDVIDNYDSRLFRDLLESLGCVQHVKVATRVSGHTLDLIITRQSDDIVLEPPWSDSLVSDHMSIFCTLNVCRTPLPVNKVSYRKLSNVRLDALNNDLASSELCLNPPDSLDDLASSYDSTLRSILDKHAPMCLKSVNSRPRVPWFTDDIRMEKKKRRKAERKWRKSKSVSDLNAFKTARNRTLYVMNKARSKYYTDCITDNSSNQKKLFGITKSLLNMTKSDLVIPPSVDNYDFVNGLGDFFEQKVVKIHCDIESLLHEEQIGVDGLQRCFSASNQHVLSRYLTTCAYENHKSLIT
ncbi:uncharacterized protein LOC121416820 [Lytechinus variegatus]|uniref:uncharacterized protein LOC121416820 n=1 Tax=Lytechinus variegatus TaxID=7654 RepID=UPI001BB1734F|nr:uncharacterized protein LOC121416820 [Lytechinus variegatus]